MVTFTNLSTRSLSIRALRHTLGPVGGGRNTWTGVLDIGVVDGVEVQRFVSQGVLQVTWTADANPVPAIEQMSRSAGRFYDLDIFTGAATITGGVISGAVLNLGTAVRVGTVVSAYASICGTPGVAETITASVNRASAAGGTAALVNPVIQPLAAYTPLAGTLVAAQTTVAIGDTFWAGITYNAGAAALTDISVTVAVRPT